MMRLGGRGSGVEMDTFFPDIDHIPTYLPTCLREKFVLNISSTSFPVLTLSIMGGWEEGTTYHRFWKRSNTDGSPPPPHPSFPSFNIDDLFYLHDTLLIINNAGETSFTTFNALPPPLPHSLDGDNLPSGIDLSSISDKYGRGRNHRQGSSGPVGGLEIDPVIVIFLVSLLLFYLLFFLPLPCCIHRLASVPCGGRVMRRYDCAA